MRSVLSMMDLLAGGVGVGLPANRRVRVQLVRVLVEKVP